jgi:hypothetical protein
MGHNSNSLLPDLPTKANIGRYYLTSANTLAYYEQPQCIDALSSLSTDERKVILHLLTVHTRTD